MGHFALGFKTLFRVWADDAFASQVGKWLGEHPAGADDAASPVPTPVLLPAEPLPRHPRTPHPAPASGLRSPAAPAAHAPAAATPPARSEALSLLAVLQRDARLLDFLQESIATYTDAEVGAAARNVHKEAAAVIDRLFGVQPLAEQAEGERVEIPPGYDPAKFRMVGNVPDGTGPMHGRIVHPGWLAVRADVPAWTGKTDNANVLSPVEVEF